MAITHVDHDILKVKTPKLLNNNIKCIHSKSCYISIMINLKLKWQGLKLITLRFI